jgi:hypothetical protein
MCIIGSLLQSQDNERRGKHPCSGEVRAHVGVEGRKKRKEKIERRSANLGDVISLLMPYLLINASCGVLV